MNILVIGSSGLLGKTIVKKFQKNEMWNVFHNGLRKKRVDLKTQKNVKKIIFETKPNLIINCSAMTNIEYCEKHKKKAWQINVGIVEKIFFIKKKYNLNFNLIQFSTDQFYNSNQQYKNNETSNIKIFNQYSYQKFKLERLCLKNKSLILRVNFFGYGTKKTESFSDWVFKSFKSKKKFYLFNDVYFNPLRIKTLSDVIIKIIKLKKHTTKGIYNIGSSDYISKSNFSIFFAKKLALTLVFFFMNRGF